MASNSVEYESYIGFNPSSLKAKFRHTHDLYICLWPKASIMLIKFKCLYKVGKNSDLINTQCLKKEAPIGVPKTSIRSVLTLTGEHKETSIFGKTLPPLMSLYNTWIISYTCHFLSCYKNFTKILLLKIIQKSGKLWVKHCNIYWYC